MKFVITVVFINAIIGIVIVYIVTVNITILLFSSLLLVIFDNYENYYS